MILSEDRAIQLPTTPAQLSSALYLSWPKIIDSRNQSGMTDLLGQWNQPHRNVLIMEFLSLSCFISNQLAVYCMDERMYL